VTWKKGHRLRLIPEDEAEGGTRQVFSEIKQALGLPVLRIFYPALATYPQFLQLHWKMARPVLQTAEFFACADRLRADADTRAHNYLRIPDLCSSPGSSRGIAADCQELAPALDLFHYADPLLLLLFAAQVQAMEGPIGDTAKTSSPASHPAFAETPVFVAEESAPPEVRHRYEEIRRVLELPYVNAEYEAMARFPEFLAHYWELLRPLQQSPVYRESQYRIRESAWNLARELPGPLELSIDQLLDAGMKQEEIASLARILDLFVKNLSGLVMNVAIAKIGIEGGNIAAQRKPVATSDSERVA
jgi:hypothetical protein